MSRTTGNKMSTTGMSKSDEEKLARLYKSYNWKYRRSLQDINYALDSLIMITPSMKLRNDLTEINILFMKYMLELEKIVEAVKLRRREEKEKKEAEPFQSRN